MISRWWVVGECAFTNHYANWWQWMGCSYLSERAARYAAATWGSIQQVRNISVVEMAP